MVVGPPTCTHNSAGRKTKTTPFELFVVSPGGSWDPGLPIAGSRAGAVGLLDLTYLSDALRARRAVARLAKLAGDRFGVVSPPLQRWGTRTDTRCEYPTAKAMGHPTELSPGRFGILIHARIGEVERAALGALESCDCVILAPDNGVDPAESAALCRKVASRVGLLCTCEDHAQQAEIAGLDFVVAKGNEAGGRVGDETCFVLLQRLLARVALPVYAWGGVGLHTAAAFRVAGAAGVFLDWQFGLMRESGLPARFQRYIAAMDGSETVTVSHSPGESFRVYARPGMSAPDKLAALSEHLCHKEDSVGHVPPKAPRDDDTASYRWNHTVGELMEASRIEDRLWPVGQDAAFAADWSARAPTVGRALALLRTRMDEQIAGCRKSQTFASGSPLARSHGTEYPVIQGPMTRVSDVPEFADAVAQAGGLPFLALALMRQKEVRGLLERTRDMLGKRPWGVGILGFVGQELRAEQLEVIKEIHPPYAIIAGGRPDQASSLESVGIATYLHVPSPDMLRMFLREGARRFIFEGSECGGHVGPRTSFVLWDTMIRVLLESGLSDEDAAEVHVVFAGGIHDAVSAAMISVVAQGLVERNMKVGLLMGSAYLFTEEIVESGAVVEGFQNVVLDADHTVVLQTGPGHAIRCAETDYTHHFESKKRALTRQSRPVTEIRTALEGMNVGRLRIASKGRTRSAQSSSADRKLISVDETDQRRLGMYMMGQVAALHHRRCTIRHLHQEVCDGATARLRELNVEPAVPREDHGPRPDPFDVAIVGMSCLLPGAADLDAYWYNILSGHDAIREIPEDRFDYRRWFDPDRRARDKIYSKWGGFLDDVPFDPIRYGIPPAAIKSIEPLQLLALETVDRALCDAGYSVPGDNPHRSRTSVILGVGGGMSELGSNYTFRALVNQYIEDADESLWSRLPEWTEDSFPGILLNVVAGRIANRFDFGGVNYIVDAACASSLAAVYQACNELANGTSDMVVTGGCDTVQNPLGYVCFSKTGALSASGRCRAFDSAADGIVISEGLAMVVLKRRRDAERDGDRIYAVIRAVAGGSDGRSKGLTAPHADGQARVLERAYRRARISPASIDLIEAHGTGTQVGDRAECQALTSVLTRHKAAPRSVALGSVKSMIGHTKCAAGVAGLIKASLALYHRVLPPTLHVASPISEISGGESPLYVNSELRPWISHPGPRRAGVSSFGFGGSNFHAVLEEYRYDARPRTAQTPHPRRSAELFVLVGRSREALARKVGDLNALISKIVESKKTVRLAELALTVHRSGDAPTGDHRVALVASGVAQLREQLTALLTTLTSEDPAGAKLPRGAYHGEACVSPIGEVAFLFPGQGSQFPDMLRDLAVAFSEVRDCFGRADDCLGEAFDGPLSRLIFPPPVFTEDARSAAFEALKATTVAQPALGVCDVALMSLLASFNVRPSMTAGHSYGELVALHAAGSMDENDLYRLSAARGRAIQPPTGGDSGSGQGQSRETAGDDPGGMLAVAADAAAVRDVIVDCESVWLANLNSPRQTVISGTCAGLKHAGQMLKAAGLACTPLPVACGFHSPLMSAARIRFAGVLSGMAFQPPRIPVYSNVTAAPYPGDAGGVRHLLTEQLVSKVRFAEQIQAMHAAGARIFVEVGPNGVLTRLVDQTLGELPHVAIATQPHRKSGVTELLHCLGRLFVNGVDVDLERLYEGRSLAMVDLEKVGDKEESSHGPNVWLINGGYARPASQPKRTPTEAVVMKEKPTSASSGSLPPADAEAFAQFQETMRVFLQTQQAVMEAYCGTAGSPSETNVTANVPASDIAEAPEEARFVAAVESPPAALPEQPVGTPAPVAAPQEPDESSLEDQLIAIVSERTGYPPDMLELDANLEADLGIDSIKRVEIIGAFRRRVLPQLEEPPAWFMERMAASTTMRAICTGVRELIGKTGDEDPAGRLVQTAAPTCSPAVERATHSPAAEIVEEQEPAFEKRSVGSEPDSVLEACPRCVAELVACPLPEDVAPAIPQGCVLLTDDGNGLADSLAKRIDSAGGRAMIVPIDQLSNRASAESMVTEIRHREGVIAGLVHLIALREAPVFPGISPSQWKAHVDVELKSLLFLLQALAPELSASQDHPLAVLSLSRSGGDFRGPEDGQAVHPWRRGLAGLLKTAAKEWPDAVFRSIDTDKAPEASLLLRELMVDEPVEVVYRDGRRWTVVARRRELGDRSLTAAARINADACGASLRTGPDLSGLTSGEPMPLSKGDVVLVTGGGRGITAQVAHEIALRSEATLILLGRSPGPEGDEEPATAGIKDPAELRQTIISQMRRNGDPVAPRSVEAKLTALLRHREIRRTVTAITEAGSQVEYLSCDVRDRASLTGVVQDVRRRYGAIDAIVHGAGVIEDRYIVDKESDSFDRVVGTKIDPILTLTDVLDADRLKFIMLFSSVAGFYGNPGQGDYAAANEILNALARRLWIITGAKVVAMNWGPWSGAGMVAPEVARQFERRGVGMVTVPAGRWAAWREITNRDSEDVVVIVGPGPWVEEELESRRQPDGWPTSSEVGDTNRYPMSSTAQSRILE